MEFHPSSMKREAHSIYSPSHQGVKGFTLMELLVVMCIMTLLLFLIAPTVRGVIQGRDVQSSARIVNDHIQLARQLALTKNRMTQVRFYQITGVGNMPGAAVAVYYDDTQQQASKAVRLPTSIVFSSDPTASSLFSAVGAFTGSDLVGGTGTSYTGVKIRPDGSANIDPGSTYTLTLIASTAPIRACNLPANFATVQWDPVTGITRIYQP
jgi:uncharacterized protein (TIGR02596 family)